MKFIAVRILLIASVLYFLSAEMVFCCYAVVFKINFVEFIEQRSPSNSARAQASALGPRHIAIYEAQAARNAKLFTENTRGSALSVLERGNTRQDHSIEAEIPRQLVNSSTERQIYGHPVTKVSKSLGLNAECAEVHPQLATSRSWAPPSAQIAGITARFP